MAYKQSSMNLAAKLNLVVSNDFALLARKFCVQAPLRQQHQHQPHHHHHHQQKSNYKLLVIGGGTGGLSTSSRFVKKLGAHNVAVVDPCEWHCECIELFIFNCFSKSDTPSLQKKRLSSRLDSGGWRPQNR